MKLISRKFQGPEWIFFVALFVVLGFQVLLSKFISYPPNQEQLPLIFALPLKNYALGFWLVKLASLAAIFGSSIIFWRMAREVFGRKVAALSGLVFVISPTTYAIWNLHPTDALKAFIVMLLCLLMLRVRSRKTLVIGLVITALTLILLSNNQPFLNIPILTALRPSAAEDEIKDRLNSEVPIVKPINIPLAIKRIAYNKPFFIYKNVLGEAISFGDVESVFFQEVNDLGNKTIVLFFWPEFIFFALGLYWWTRRQSDRNRKFIALLTAVGFADFLLLNKPPYQQFFLSAFPLSVFISLGAVNLSRYRFCGTLLALAIGYAFLINYIDVATRPAFWFDNRPLAYQFMYQEVQKYDSQSQHVLVTSLIGRPELYCKYYLGSCPAAKFEFGSFDLKDRPPRGGFVYAGFLGEFLGPDLLNSFPTDWPKKLAQNNLTIESFYQTRDTIAYHYGDTAVVAIAR